MTGQILIADAQATNRITLKVRLSAACYDILTASGVDQAMQAAETQRCDLVIVGSGLPDDEQARLCAALRQIPRQRDIPVLVLCRDDMRLSALRAGASAVLDPQGDEFMLLARVRGLLRDAAQGLGTPLDAISGFAEPRAEFGGQATVGPAVAQRIALIADRPARALAWKYALAPYLAHRLQVRDPDQALTDVAAGRAADLYLLAADIDQPGEGLRLLSELRSRPASRHAAFIVATPTERPDLAAIALDLGAGDTVPLLLAAPDRIETAVIAIDRQLAQKALTDQRRTAAERSLTWAMTDPLTGLYNRRYALPRLAEAMRDAQTRGSALSVLVMDIDRFKQINDRHGHAAGDAALRETASRIERVVGLSGLVARMGGEEFVAILPGVSVREACAQAEAIRAEVMGADIALPFEKAKGPVRLTLSIGVASLRERDLFEEADATAEALLDRADRAMMAAKSKGRNRVIPDRGHIAA
ncbi:diguanylate cyclase [Paracoccus sp. TK19116]|uniref:diguanylate cyclase n=2 Tax=Paracoccus albicereus TaxID=2922394 RepID=A0ABT1MU46_9RHOB|nr:diguanylate cyclase [Paracoccus albicereus]